LNKWSDKPEKNRVGDHLTIETYLSANRGAIPNSEEVAQCEFDLELKNLQRLITRAFERMKPEWQMQKIRAQTLAMVASVRRYFEG